jgi:tetratricopeptide (TPR) repeat protein
VRELDQKAAADRARRQARSVTRAIEKSAEANFESDDPVTDQEIENALEGIEHALKQRPDDVWLHIHAAKLRMEQYRRAELQENIAPQGGMPQTGPTPLTIFHWSQLYHQYGLEEPLDQLRKNANVQKYVVPAMRHAILARRACPFLEMPHHLIAQLVGLVGSPQEYRRHLDRAILAYPSDPDVHLLSGILQYAVGDIIQAVEHWRAGLRQSTVHREQILQLADPQGQAVPEFLDRLFPDDPHLLLGLAIGHYRENQEAKEHLLHRAAKALRETERIPPAEKQYMFGRIQWYLGQYEEALEHHKNALLLSPGQTQWRYVYALRLRERGRTTDALRQAKLCIRDKPSNTRYRRLHRELTREALLATPEEEESHEAETTP